MHFQLVRAVFITYSAREILAGRGEHLDQRDIGQCQRAMRQAAGHSVAITRAHRLAPASDGELQSSGNHVANLIMRVGMFRHLAAALDEELHQHQAIGRAQHAPVNARAHFVLRFLAGQPEASLIGGHFHPFQRVRKIGIMPD